MAKKTTGKKDATPMDDFNPIMCQLRHEGVEKDFIAIKTDAGRRHEEIKELITSVKKEIIKDTKASHINLRDKIVLVDKTVGDKIDSLSEFDDTLKGNGTPGVWENIRSLNRMMKVLLSIVTIIVILELGGSVNRLNWNKIKEKIWGPVIKQVEPTDKQAAQVEADLEKKEEIEIFEVK